MDHMATAKKKASSKRAKAAPKKSAKKSSAKKTAASGKKTAKVNVFRNAMDDALEQMDEFVDSVKLKAKHLAAKEKLMQKKAELAAKAEIDKARHLAQQAEKWMKARIKSDTRKVNALEKKLSRQLRNAERKLMSQARAAEKKANKQGKALKKKFEAEANKAFGKTGSRKNAASPKKKVAAAKKKAAAPKKKAATAKKKTSRAKKK
jgi:hypothetical protein